MNFTFPKYSLFVANQNIKSNLSKVSTPVGPEQVIIVIDQGEMWRLRAEFKPCTPNFGSYEIEVSNLSVVEYKFVT